MWSRYCVGKQPASTGPYNVDLRSVSLVEKLKKHIRV